MRKLRMKRGESISETLIAVLIMALMFTMLTGAVITAARINSRLKNDEAAFRAGTEVDGADGWGVVLRMGDQQYRQSAKLYETENGYYYYEYIAP